VIDPERGSGLKNLGLFPPFFFAFLNGQNSLEAIASFGLIEMIAFCHYLVKTDYRAAFKEALPTMSRYSIMEPTEK